MDSSRLKTIILVLLLSLNIALLAVVIADRQASITADEELQRTALSVLEENGLQLADGTELSAQQPRVYSVTRSLDDEEKYAGAVLGNPLSVQDSGGIRYYEGSTGMGRFHGTGEFEVYLTSGTYTGSDNGIRTSIAFLKDMGVEVYEPLTVSTNGNSGVIVTTVCAVKDAPVYNCAVTLSFIDESLMAISGYRPFYDVKESESGEAPLDIYTVLLRFLSVIRSEGAVGRELTDVELGYKLVSSLSGESLLTPVWHFVTDTGEYYIDGLTGEQIVAF